MAAEKKSELVEQWERVQTKVFTNWTNSHLVKRGLKIESVASGLADGVNLIQLLEIISEETFPKYEKNPKMRIHKVENVGRAIKFITDHGVKLASIGAEEIVDGNLKLTLGMVWTIILRFAIAGLSEEGLSAKEGLLLWCQRKTEPYDNVNVKDFTVSFQDGLAFCALIHRHRPDLIDYHKLTSEDKLGNLNLAFDVAKEHLDVARILDAEDIVNMPRPDERSIMTYVALLYKVFSSHDKIETAGRRVGKYVSYAKSLNEMIEEYERRTTALKAAVNNRASNFGSDPLGNDYASAKAAIAALVQYKKKDRRTWVTEQADLVTLFGNIQSKQKTQNRPPYVPPAGLAPADVEKVFETLYKAEAKRRADLKNNLHAILEALRQNFATPANALGQKLHALRSALAETVGDLEQQLATFTNKQRELASLSSQLPAIQEAERLCEAANIDDNEYTDHTYDDLEFEHSQLTKVYAKKISFIESQIAAAAESRNVTPEQLQEFKETFAHFDSQKKNSLSRLDFKSCLSGLGVVEIDFEGGNAVFESIFKRVSAGSDQITFEQFLDYMISITADTTSKDQLQDSFDLISGGKGYVTENDLKSAAIPADQIAFLTANLPKTSNGYDYKAWLASQF